MLKSIARIDWSGKNNSLFLTLTYPDECWTRDYTGRTGHRHLFVRDLERKVKYQLPHLWRVEWKPRMTGPRLDTLAPHVHFVIFHDVWIPIEWVTQRWADIIGYPHHVQTDIELLDAGNAAALYASKYAAKDSLSGLDNDAYLNTSCGRCYGFHLKGKIPFRTKREVPSVPAEVVIMAQDMAAQLTGVRHAGGFVLLNERAEHLFARLVEKCGLDS